MQASGKDLLLGLPCELTYLLVGSWLDLRDVVNVDSAYCQSVKRPALLSALSAPVCMCSTQSQSVMKSTISFVQWMMKRSIQVDTIVVTDFDPVYLRYVERFGPVVQHITLKKMDFKRKLNPPTRIYNLLQRCTTLLTLHINNCSMEYMTLHSVLENVCESTLRELRIQDNDRHIKASNQKVPPRAFSVSKLVLICDPLLSASILQMCEPIALQHLQVAASHPLFLTLLFSVLPQCTNLFSVGFCGDVDDNVLTTILDICPQVTHLNLSSCVALSDNTAVTIAHTLRRLVSLDVSDTYYTDILMDELASQCKDSLEVLNVDFCVDVTREGLHNVTSHCRRLHTLHICVQHSARYDFSVVRNVTTLHVNFDDWLDPTTALQRLASYCGKVEHLHLQLRYVNAAVLQPLNSDVLKKLRSLHITSTGSNDGFGPRSQAVILNALLPQLPRTIIVVNA